MEANGRLEKQIGLNIDFYLPMIGCAIVQAVSHLASHNVGPGLAPRAIDVGFVVDKVTLGHVTLR
jgi:Na+-driven multidrug efflux pump